MQIKLKGYDGHRLRLGGAATNHPVVGSEHCVIESQNRRDWKRPLEFIEFNPPAGMILVSKVVYFTILQQ